MAVRITWTKSTSTHATQRIYRSAANDDSSVSLLTTINDNTTELYEDLTQVAGDYHRYEVRAVTADGVESTPLDITVDPLASTTDSVASVNTLMPPDTTAPTVILSTPTLNVSDDFLLTATFSESVTGVNFGHFMESSGDFLTGTFTAVSSTVYTFLVDVSASTGFDTSGVYPVLYEPNSDVVVDAAGNQTDNSNTLSINYTLLDTTAPTVILSTPTLNVSDDFLVTATFSEPVTGMSAAKMIALDLIFNLAGTYTVVSPSVYTFLVDVSASVFFGNSSGTHTLQLYVTSSPIVDMAGNAMTADSNPLSVVYTGPSTVLVSDTFTESSDTALQNHTPDIDVAGNGWTILSGAFTVDSSTDTLSDTNGSGTNMAAIDTGKVFVDISADLTIGSAGNNENGLFFRASMDGSGWIVDFHKSSQTLRMWRWSPGFSLVDSVPISFSTGDTFTLRVMTDETNTINAYVDGVLKLTTVSTIFAGGTMQGVAQRWIGIADNFTVDGIPDTVSPTVSLTTPDSTVNGAFTVTATFSEPVTGITSSDFVVSNSTIANFAGSGTTYTIEVTPTATPVTIEIPANAGQDAAGNNSTAATQLSVVYNDPATTPPTVFLSSPIPFIENADPFTVKAQFSAAVTGLVEADFVVTNAAKSSVTTVDADTYLITITPTGLATPVTVFLPAGAASNLVGTDTLASNTMIVSVPVTSTVLVSDTFTEVTDIALQNHTPDVDVAGNGWQTANNPHTIDATNDRAKSTSAIGQALTVIDVGTPYVDIEVGVTIIDEAGIRIRHNTVDNGGFDIVFVRGRQQLEVIERPGYTLQAFKAWSITSGDSWTLRVTTDSNNDIKVYVDGVLELTYNSTFNNTSTIHGIDTFFTGYHDNLIIKSM